MVAQCCQPSPPAWRCWESRGRTPAAPGRMPPSWPGWSAGQFWPVSLASCRPWPPATWSAHTSDTTDQHQAFSLHRYIYRAVIPVNSFNLRLGIRSGVGGRQELASPTSFKFCLIQNPRYPLCTDTVQCTGLKGNLRGYQSVYMHFKFNSKSAINCVFILSSC